MLHRLGSKTGSYVYQGFKFEVNYEVALVVRPILSVDESTSKGVQVVFGVGVNSSYIQLLDGHKIPLFKRKRRSGVKCGVKK